MCYISGKFDLVRDDIPAWFRVEQGRMIRNVIFLVFRNFGKGIVGFQDWKSFAEEIQSLCFDHIAEIRKKKNGYWNDREKKLAVFWVLNV